MIAPPCSGIGVQDSHSLLLYLQVCPKFLRNMRFAKKHNKKGMNAVAKKE